MLLSKQEIKYEKQLVLFIDILGTKNRHKEFAEYLLRKLYNQYKLLGSDIDFLNSFDEQVDTKFKIFSDNVAVVNKIRYNNLATIRNHIHNMVMTAMWFQSSLLKAGFLSRGGISYGECFIDDVMIMGDGLIEAYTIESQLAIYPRVVLSSKIVDEFNFIDKYITQDSDGLYYVDYIKNQVRKDRNKELIDNEYSFVCDSINNADNDRIAQKYRWLKNKMDIYLN